VCFFYDDLTHYCSKNDGSAKTGTTSITSRETCVSKTGTKHAATKRMEVLHTRTQENSRVLRDVWKKKEEEEEFSRQWCALKKIPRLGISHVDCIAGRLSRPTTFPTSTYSNPNPNNEF
jgi:hypothetical protein